MNRAICQRARWDPPRTVPGSAFALVHSGYRTCSVTLVVRIARPLGGLDDLPRPLVTAVLADMIAFDGLYLYNGNEGVHVNDVVCMKLDVVLFPPLPVDSMVVGIGYTFVTDLSL